MTVNIPRNDTEQDPKLHTWFGFDWKGRSRLRADGCYIGKLFVLREVRGYCRPRHAFLGDHLTYALDRYLAQRRAEWCRKQGSAFTIEELPALIVTSCALALIVCDTGTSEPFKYTNDVFAGPKTLRRIGVKFKPHSPLSMNVRRFLTPELLVPHARLPFYRWHSHLRGAGGRLGWHPTTIRHRRWRMDHLTRLVGEAYIHLSGN